MMAAALRRAVVRAGAPGGIRFTERQLYYELCRTLQPLGRLPRRPAFTVPVPIGYRRFAAALRRWPGEEPAGLAARQPGQEPGEEPGEVPGLLTGPRPAAPAPPPEVFEYGLPRVLLCQHRETADMLLANRLHMESACPVFALDDLPLDPRLSDAVRRGDGRVYVLHDASPPGFGAVAAVRRWADDLPVAALGLRPTHAATLHLPRIRLAATDDLHHVDGLEAWEARWLRSGRVSEVAAVNPARLLRTVHRLVRNQNRPRRSLPRLRRLAAVGYLSWPDPGGSA